MKSRPDASLLMNGAVKHKIVSNKFPYVKILETAAATRVANMQRHYHCLTFCQMALDHLDGLYRSWANDISNHQMRAVRWAMWTGLVVDYARCFHGGREALKPRCVFAGDPEALDSHQFFWTMRSKHYAHDLNKHRSCRMAVTLTADGAWREIAAQHGQSEMSDSRRADFRRLVEKTITYVSNETTMRQVALEAELNAMSARERLALKDMEMQGP